MTLVSLMKIRSSRRAIPIKTSVGGYCFDVNVLDDVMFILVMKDRQVHEEAGPPSVYRRSGRNGGQFVVLLLFFGRPRVCLVPRRHIRVPVRLIFHSDYVLCLGVISLLRLSSSVIFFLCSSDGFVHFFLRKLLVHHPLFGFGCMLMICLFTEICLSCLIITVISVCW
jgi:hypothetical protein